MTMTLFASMFAGVIMFVVIAYLCPNVTFWVTSSLQNRCLLLCFYIVLGLFVYAAVLKMFGIDMASFRGKNNISDALDQQELDIG